MMKVIYSLLFLSLISSDVFANHFRGGTINWKPTGNGNEVEFRFKLGWTYGHGPGCTETKIGQYVTGGGGNWICTSGCPTNVVVSNTSYICTGASQSEDWEQGEYTFMYTFTSQGPFTIGFSGGAWMVLDYGSPSNWNVETVVDLRPRNDTGRPNSSPISGSKPMYSLQFGCQNTLQIPMTDADGDRVKCRWAVGDECDSVCNALPNAQIDQDTCTITFKSDVPSSYVAGGWYAVAVTVEDYPKSNISIGGNLITTNTPISTIPLQFLINTPAMSGGCNERPVFVNNTPSENDLILIPAGQELSIQYYAQSGHGISDITFMSPAGAQTSSLTSDDFGRPNVQYKTVSWTPTQADHGAHLLCGTAEDNQGKTSDPRCITILAWDRDPCDTVPCQNNGTCVRTGFTQDYMCICGPYYTGTHCQDGIDYCQSAPCLHGGRCINHLTTFTCECTDAWYGYICEYKNDTSECTYSYSDCSCVIGPKGSVPANNRDVLCGSIGMFISLFIVILTYITYTNYILSVNKIVDSKSRCHSGTLSRPSTA